MCCAVIRGFQRGTCGPPYYLGMCKVSIRTSRFMVAREPAVGFATITKLYFSLDIGISENFVRSDKWLNMWSMPLIAQIII